MTYWHCNSFNDHLSCTNLNIKFKTGLAFGNRRFWLISLISNGNEDKIFVPLNNNRANRSPFPFKCVTLVTFTCSDILLLQFYIVLHSEHSKKFRSYYQAKITNYPNHYYDFTMGRTASENPNESNAPLTDGYGILPIRTFANLLWVIVYNPNSHRINSPW